MTIIKTDIARYQGYKEFAEDGFRSCHPDDEAYFNQIIQAHDLIITAMQLLEGLQK